MCEPISSIIPRNWGPYLRELAMPELCLLGEASHGTSEFYRMTRHRITPPLITKKGFHLVAIEGDWPDAARVITSSAP